MIRSCLIIVPHPDDEINLAGGFFETLKEANVYVTVVICTNGDYVSKYTERRILEAKKVQALYGYDKLIFLGYGDNYKDTHIYDLCDGEIATSCCDRDETYSVSGDVESCFFIHGEHHKYTRSNYKNDIKDVIISERADMIICVDQDRHPDHRCVSLLFDECMRDIINHYDYHPFIFKAFAYIGVWYGSKDFFSTLQAPTQLCLDDGGINVANSFPYNWDNRVQINNSENVLRLDFWNNPVFKALWAYKTQQNPYPLDFCALANFPRIANPDTCLFYRPLGNLSLKAKITASSGDTTPINDFILAKPKTVRNKIISEDLCSWIPSSEDKTPFIIFEFGCIKEISTIRIYQSAASEIMKVILIDDKGASIRYTPECNLYMIEITLPTIHTRSLKISFEKSQAHPIAINEIELYTSYPNLDFSKLPFRKYTDTLVSHNRIAVVLSKNCFSLFVFLLKCRNYIINKTHALLNRIHK